LSAAQTAELDQATYGFADRYVTLLHIAWRTVEVLAAFFVMLLGYRWAATGLPGR
jgi:hypothetical protein